MAVSKLQPFNPSSDDVESWTSVLQNYLVASGVDKNNAADVKKASAIFLSAVGVPTYTLLKDLLSPDKPEDKTFDVLVTTLQSHYKPAPKAIAERYKFFNRRQQPGESVSVYLSELRRIAVTCKFDNLDTSLRDQFVVGLSSETAQRELFKEDDNLTLQNAVKIAISQEAAESSTKLIRGVNTMSISQPSSSEQTNKVSTGKHFQKSNSSGGKSTSGTSDQSCTKCGQKHSPSQCPYTDVECYKCHRKGHFSRHCRSKSSSSVEGKGTKSDSSIKNVRLRDRNPPIEVNVEINGKLVVMELDTGAGRSFISRKVWQQIGSPKLIGSNITFTTFTGEEFVAKGKLNCQVVYNKQSVNHEIFVINDDSSSLFGRDLLFKFQMDWKEIKSKCSQVNNVNRVSTLSTLLDEFKDVFDKPVGTVKNFKAKLVLRDDAVPRFFKARPVPYAVRSKVDEELQKMEAAGVITRVEHSDWASPVVVVPKANGNVRITGDFKKTINSQLCVNQYPLARVDDLMETISGGATFSKLDGSDAFHQVEVEESCRKFLVINTHRGLFQYNVLPQGIASSPAIFQEMMDNMLRGVPKTGAFVDDAITTGRDDSQHLVHLKKIFERMRAANYRLSRSKCEFMKKNIKFLGSVICQEGIRTDPAKVEAVMSMKEPENVSEVSSFLGLVNFYAKHIPHLSTICEPLNALKRKETEEWRWTKKCKSAFNQVKQSVTNGSLLTHYDQSVPVGITCDASSVGVGVVLFHRYPDGTEKPIAYASKTLTSAERNYSQIEKEALAIYFGINRFLKYLFGVRFILVTDHAPLLAIFGNKRDVPSLAATRLHRWSLFLSGFSYDIEYRSTHDHGNADALSRLPVPDMYEEDEDSNVTVKRVQEENPTTSKKVRFHTSRDPVLSKVMSYVQSGWPDKQSKVPEAVRPFFSHRFEYTVEEGIVMWGIRVVVPSSLHQSILSQLHDTHPGIVRMKSLARQYVFWPGIDNDIEATVKSCHTCAVNRDNPAAAPLHPWSFPEKSWQRLHMDLAGPFKNNMWLIIVDAFSKWPEVIPLGKDTTSRRIILHVREIIARFGIPDTVVTDNGPQFVSEEFEKFCSNNGIRHTTSSAYHPRSNGEAERFVRTFKNGLSSHDGGDLNLSLCDFLLTYRITPHATTGVSPSEAMLKRKPRTLFDLLRPSAEANARKSQEKQKENDHKSQLRQFIVGQAVWIRTFSKNNPGWSLGNVVQVCGPLSYKVDVDGHVYKRHVDHMYDAEVIQPSRSSPTPAADDDDEVPVVPDAEPIEEEATEEPQQESVRRYPERNRRQPQRYPN